MPTVVDLAAAQPGSAEWWLARLNRRLLARQANMTLMDDYYHGRHRATFKVRQVLEAFGLRQALNVNYAGVVVDSLNERLGVEGFRFGAADARDADAASSAAWAIWQANNLDAGFKRGMRAGLVKGEFSLIVWPDASGEPTITVEDGAEVVVAFDPANHRTRRAALKRWHDEDLGQTFATVYLPGAIYKYELPASASPPMTLGSLPDGFGHGGGAGTTLGSGPPVDISPWQRREVDGEAWPLVNPFGEVPVFGLPNKPDLAGVGESELGPVVPIQDAINANVANAMLAGLYGAFRQKYGINVELEPDPSTGKPKMPWDIAIDRMITAPPPEAGGHEVKFGEFGQSDLKGYIDLHETYVKALATISRIPGHYLLFGSAFPSGEALTAAERGLSEKARERMVDASVPLEDAMRFAFRVRSAKPGLPGAEAKRLIKWAATVDAEVKPRDPETRSESQHVDALVKMLALQIPLPAIWAKLPASPQEIQAWSAVLPPTGTTVTSTSSTTPAATIVEAVTDALSGAQVGTPPADAAP